MRPGRSILILALAAAAGAYEIANPGFDARDGGRPDGWMTYGWGRPVAGILAESVDDADGRCLRLGATAEGSAGVISSPIALAEPAALRIRLRLRPSADYAGNRPWVFLSAHRGGAFLDQTGVPLPALPAGAWTMVDVVVPADRLPAGLEMVRLNIATQRHAAADAPATGHLDADDIAISEDRSAPTVAIACDRFASWSVAGQPVSFRIASGGLGRRARQVAVRVVDSLGAAVAAQAVAATTFAAEGWTWTPPGPGFYDIFFTAGIEREGRIEAVPLTQSYVVRPPSRRDLAFTRDRWSLAVAAAPTRPMPERSPLFGFSYQLGPEDEVRLADLIGLSFARIHAIPWGSQFSDVRRAIEPERGVYRWDELDEKVGWLHARGYAMVGNVLYTPQWASPHPEDTKVDICVPGFAAWAPRDLGDWTRFLEKLVERYGDRISTWELWNEPHLPGGSCFWHDTPERFVAMLQAGYDTLKRVQPGCEVWIGGVGMRYVPFYRQLARLGGLSAFDRLALHGSWCDPAPFHAIERAAGAQPKPWANSEQHGILLNPGAEIPSERALARRLVLDSFGQLARGAQRLALFQIPEYMDAEVLPAARAEGWFIHSSGLFRARPRVEPRLPALVWHTVIAEVRPGMAIRSQHRLGDVRVLALGGGGDASGDLLLAWSDAAAALPEQLARIAAGAAVIDWEGRPVAAWSQLSPEAMYLVRGADPALVAALPAGEAIPPPRRARGAAGPTPAASATWGDLPEQPDLVPAATWVEGATPEAVQASFAVAGDARGLVVRVDVRDPELSVVDRPGLYWQGDSVQIALDTGGAGVEGDQVQFIAALAGDGPVVWKDAAPYIGGDLPSGWTPAGRRAAHASAEIAPIAGGMRYTIRVDASELYPLVPDRGQPLRFSLLVNSNRGQGRAGWVEWGSGIGAERNPAAYGTLTWR